MTSSFSFLKDNHAIFCVYHPTALLPLFQVSLVSDNILLTLIVSRHLIL